MTYDPDLYGPPEHGNEDPTMEDDWPEGIDDIEDELWEMTRRDG